MCLYVFKMMCLEYNGHGNTVAVTVPGAFLASEMYPTFETIEGV